MTDTELITQILRGQTTLFEQLVDRYLPLVRGVCASRFRDPATVDDLTQDTFITGFRNLNKLRNPARFGPWLATIARNTCTSHLRSVTRRSAMVERAAKEPNGHADTPEAIAQRRELYGWVHRAIDKLPDKTREAMVLHYVEGLSTTDVAAQTGIRETAVRKRLQYGRQLVGETLWKEVEPQRAAAKPDTEAAKRRVLKALPLAAAPWLMDGGKAAAATGLLGSLGFGGLAKIGLGAAIVIAAALAWNASRDRSEISNVNVPIDTEAATRDVSSVALPAQEKESDSAEVDAASSAATGALTVQVNLKRKDPHPAERTDSGAVVKQLVYQPPVDSGQAVPRAIVRVIPMQFKATRIESLFARTEVDPELAKRVVKAISAIYESRLGMIHGAASESERTNAALIMAESGVSEADMQDAMNQLQQALSESENPNEDIMSLLFAPAPQSEWVEEATDESGSVTIAGLAPGRYFVAALDPEVAPKWPAPKPDDVSLLQSMDTTGTGMMETAIGGVEPQQVTVLIDDERSRFTGTVIDAATGEPIEKARVEVVSLDVPGEEDYTHTNAEGQYWITPQRVGYGTLHVRVTANNYQPVEFSQERVLGVQTERQSVELTTQTLVCGSVTTFDGKPAPDVSILRWSGDSGRGAATTDADGRYCLGHDGGPVTLSASVGKLWTERITLHLAPQETGTADFVLPPAGSILLNATNASDEPVTTLKDVNVIDLATGRRTNQYSELSSEDGVYQFNYIEAGEYHIDARADGLDALELDRVKVAVGQSAGPYYVRLELEQTDLTIRLEDADGAPQANYYFNLHRILAWDDGMGSHGENTDQIANVRTDAKGQYAFAGLAMGLYRVDRGSSSGEVEVPHAGVFVVREESGPKPDKPSSPSLFLGAAPYRIGDGQKVPIHGDGAKTYVVPLSSAEGSDLQSHLLSGTVVTEPGPYLLLFVNQGHTAGIIPVEVSESDFETYKQKQLLMEVEIEDGGSVEGALVDAEGMPVANHEIGVLPVALWELALVSNIHVTHWMNLATSLAQGAQTDETGAFTINHLPTGTYVVGVSGDAVSQPIEVVAGHVTGPMVIVDAE